MRSYINVLSKGSTRRRTAGERIDGPPSRFGLEGGRQK